jgi:hypothetical protein
MRKESWTTWTLLLGALVSIPAAAQMGTVVPKPQPMPPALAAPDLCASLQDRSLTINANGYKGVVAPYTPGLQLSKGADGTYTFESGIQFEGEKIDKLSGTCKGRYVTLKRVRDGAFVQDYKGWIFEKNGSAIRGMGGTFAHNGVESYGWCGETRIPGPK